MLPLTQLLTINLLIGTSATLLVLGVIVPTINHFQSRLEKLATVDTLTGLLNRSTGEAILGQTLKDARRNLSPFCVMLFDIDHFKRVNDTHGHAVGDSVIRTVAQLARDTLRQNDALVRWGGEEFMVVLKACTLPNALRLAENIRTAVALHPFEISTAVTISLGVAEHRPEESINDLTVRADASLYDAKHNGKNQVVASGQQVPALLRQA